MTVEEKIALLESKLTAMSENYAHALSIIETQSARIVELEQLLFSQKVVKTSQNSHIPPFSDLTRKNQSLREKSDRPVGGQKGHKGYTLKMSKTPDKIEKLYPDFCNACGQSLNEASFELLGRRQVVDIPPIVPITTEYQNFGTVCTCDIIKRVLFPKALIITYNMVKISKV